jgi:D-arabinose 1-dehydrogenase-like Zn-dependent alcohol dehydrogenase
MKAMQVTAPGGPFELVERPIPEPKSGWVRIKVKACGICHSDMLVKMGYWPNLQYPRVTGHEVAGIIDALGPDVGGDGSAAWKIGQRVGVGWYGGHCTFCEPCRRGNFTYCENGSITGFTQDGGYQEYMLANVQALAHIPDDLSFEDAAPLMCAGITTYNSLRHAGAMPGDLVAIQAIGGLGHLAIQYARKFGYRVAAISRGPAAKELALHLGAHDYIDSEAKNPGEALKAMGGAKVIIATAPSGKAQAALVSGLGVNGKLLVIGASADPIEVTPIQLIGGGRIIQGWAAGTSMDSEDTLKFSALSGVRPMIETFPLEKANEAYDRMESGKSRFRVVLTM